MAKTIMIVDDSATMVMSVKSNLEIAGFNVETANDGVQALTNLCVAMAILPTKGLTLPFLSYGGSSLVVNAAAIGILLNISRPRLPRELPIQQRQRQR